MSRNKTVALIPVRGGSKSIPLKNIKKINGRPLVYWTIDAAVSCDLIDEVYISTDSEEIKKAVDDYDKDHKGRLKCIERDPLNATDTASTEDVLLEFVSNYKSETVVLIQATSPLLQYTHLSNAIKKYKENRFDSILSVVRQKRFSWKENSNGEVTPINYSVDCRPRRQDMKGSIIENGAFYISSYDNILESNLRVSGKIGYYEMPEDTYYEIDEPSDWIIIEQLLKTQKKEKRTLEIKNIKLLAIDCDGVLTDAGMYYSNEGDSLKKFNTKDGMGISMLMQSGILVSIITGENSEIVQKRSEKLRIEDYFLGCKNKVEAMDLLLEKYQLTYEEVAFIGDDINDLELLRKVGTSFAVNDAMDIVKSSVDYITKRKGGEGAVREVADLILVNKV